MSAKDRQVLLNGIQGVKNYDVKILTVSQTYLLLTIEHSEIEPEPVKLKYFKGWTE